MNRDGTAEINESKCFHCYQCLQKDCLRFDSIVLPKERSKGLIEEGVKLWRESLMEKNA